MTSIIFKLLLRFWPRILMAWGLVSVLDVGVTRGLTYFGMKSVHNHHQIAELMIPVFALIIPFLWARFFKPVAKFILMSGFLTALLLVALHYSKVKFPHSDTHFLAGLFLAVSAVLLAIKLRRFKKRAFVELTMEQIDKFGNGNTYIAGHMFEEYIVSLYRRLGYETAISTTELRKKGLLPAGIQKRAGSGEQGVDVVIDFFENNQANKPKRVIIQCKHYSAKVPNSAIQEIHSAINLYNADYAIVLTNNYFTEPAIELAQSNNVSLIDRDSLAKLIAGAGVTSTSSHIWERIEQTIPVKS